MLKRRLILSALVVALLVSAPLAARQQSAPNNARERARAPYESGLAHLRNEKLEDAVRSFEEAIRLDETFDSASNMLGRTPMALRNNSSPVLPLQKGRTLYQADSPRPSPTKRRRKRPYRHTI